MQTIYVKTHFPKQRSMALTVAVGLVLALVYVLSDDTEASGATVSASGGSCTQTVGSNTGVTVAVVDGKCVVTFPTAGTTTWTVPAGVSSVRTLVVGGGGGAGGGGCNWMYGRGGGGGNVVDTAATAVTPGASVNIIVGAGGSAPANTKGCDGPPGVTTLGGVGGSSRFASESTVLGGSSSPTLGSIGGTSGNNNLGSGGAGAGNTMNSWSGGGGGGAGGPGTQSGSGSNWQCGGLLLGNGGPGLFSDITGTSIGHGGGAASAGCSGNGSATSGGEYYLSGYFRSVGSYGGGGMSTTGGAGVVIISYIPVAARLIGNGGTIKTFTNAGVCAGGLRGMATDGTYVYFRTLNSASNICIANLSTGAFVRVQAVSGGSLSTLPFDQMALTYASGCIFIRNSISAASTVYCIDTTTWVMSSAITPTGAAIPAGGYWLSGNLMNFPDGRVGAVAGPTSTVSTGGATSGANVCPTGSYCKILRTYTVTRSGGTTSLAFSEDFTLADPNPGWPNDDHGMATDGTYLYQMMYNNGYKVWSLNSGTPSRIVFDGAGSGTCTAPTGISGSMCNINKPISETSADNFGVNGVENATYLGRSHSTNQYIMGVVSANKFWVSDAVAPPQGPGSSVTVISGAPTIGLATATGGTTANVAFTAPASDGGATITSYTATSSPAGGTGTLSQAGSGTISVTGLTTGVAYTFTVTATNSVGTSAASAASNSITPSYTSTITVPETTYVSASATTNINGLSVGGLAAGSTYQVALSLSAIPTGASLKLPTTTGLTASYGFTSGSNTFSSFTTLTFSGLLANVNTALAALQYVSGSTTGSPIVQVTVSSLDTNYALNGYNGHFYVSNTTLSLANATYLNARATAKLQSYRGLTGYLTTITSAGENSFISNNIASASNIFFGATDELVEGAWRWDTSGGSPEAGTQFWQGVANGYAVGGQYSSWAGGEPNNSGDEDYPVTNWQGSSSTWNDCRDGGCGTGRAYVIEFGTSASDGGFVNSSSNLASSSFSLFYATSGQLPSVLVVDPQSSSRYLPITLNTVGPTNLLLCLNESDISGNNLASPTINFDVAANGGAATTSGSGTSTISGDRTTATYIYGVTANVLTTLNSVLGTQIYLSSGTFSATKYVRIRAITITSSSSLGSRTCASSVYTSQNIEIRPLALERIMKKGTITLKN